MPEHNRASDEHAIMQEVTAPLAGLPDDPVREVQPPDFPIVLRGYDRLAVDAYVKKTAQLVAELHATRAPEAAIRRALERVGEQISGILQRAHETAEQITAQSRAEAEDRLERAREEARMIVESAREKLKALDADTDRIWGERDRIVGDVRKLAVELDELAVAAGERFPPEPDAGTTQAVPLPDLQPEAEQATELQPEGAEPTELVDEAEQPTALVEGGVPPAPAAEPVVAIEPTPVAAVPHAFDLAEPQVIDLLHLGHARVIGCWQVGDVLIDPGPESCLEQLLAALGDARPRALLLTHIHLDHAGASGSLVRRWPELEVYVHERGAPHMADPSRLLESARRLYGEDMDRLWGEMAPVPERNLRVLGGGEWLLDGRFEVAYTPGHASHHVSYLYEGTAFVGDVAGVRITPDSMTIPPTPPPDIDIEAWQASIARVAAWRPRRLAMTHFGDSTDVEAQLDEVAERLDNWAALARTEDRATFIATVREEISRDAGPAVAEAYEQAAPAEQLYAGLERYWRKRGGTAEHPAVS